MSRCICAVVNWNMFCLRSGVFRAQLGWFSVRRIRSDAWMLGVARNLARVVLPLQRGFFGACKAKSRP